MALLEFYILRRYYGRRSLAGCIYIGAVISGILYGAIMVGIDLSAGYLKVPQTTFERLSDLGTSFIIYVLLMSILALIPSAVAAMIYRNWIKTP